MKFSLIAVEHMLIQQKYQTMYFDNYLKSNPSTLTQKLDQSTVSIFHQQSVNNFEPVQFNPRPYFNPRITENTNTPSPGVNKNFQQPPKHYMAYQTGTTQHNVQRQPSFQVKNNISFNSEQPTSANNRENSEFMKRRDSNTQNTFLRSNQGHSPSHGKSFGTDNSHKTSVKLSMVNEQQRNMHPTHKQSGSSNNLLNMTPSTYREQDYSMNPMPAKENKETFQEKQDKSGYFNSSNYSQYGFSETKASSKPYALGFKTGVQNFDGDSRRTLQHFPKERPLQEKEHLYNYQLKNTANELTSFHKPNAIGNQQFKYYTPSLAKKSSLKDDSTLGPKNGFSQLIDIRHNNNMLERQANAVKENTNLTDRQIHKSPSFDILTTKDNFRTKIASTLESNHPSETNSKQSSQQSIIHNPIIDNRPYTNSKPSSESFLADPSNDKQPKQSAHNYHALIQNLEKKFSEQKKSSETFENKEKTYMAEISKRDEKIKRLQTIIENNKQTISALDETIRQLRKKIDSFKDDAMIKADTANVSSVSMIEQLKKENGGLKEELKKQRKKSVSLAEQAFQKQISERQQLKIKQLQRVLIESNSQRQSLSQQVAKLKESTSLAQDSYSQQVKQHEKTKSQVRQLLKVKDELKEFEKSNKDEVREFQKKREQLQRAKQQIEQLSTNLKQKAQSFTQVKSVLLNLEQKYEGSLKKLLTQEDDFNLECSQLREKLQSQRKQKPHQLDETEKLCAKLQRLNGEIDFKAMKIKTLEEQLSEKEVELQNFIASHQKIAYSNQLSLNQTISICIEETKMAKEKLSLKQHAYEALAVQFSEKNRYAETLTRENSIYIDQIKTLQTQIQALQVKILQTQTNKVEENHKNNTDSAEIKTRSSDSTKQSFQLREAFSLLELYHQKYAEIVSLFNLTQSASQKSLAPQTDSMILISHQNSQSPQPTSKLHPTRQYLTQYHPLLSDEAKKVLKDMKKLLGVLKECQTDSQHKTQRLHQLDKTMKKQLMKINQLLGEIHLKNISILEINNMQVEKDIFRLNEKYQILSHVGLADV